MESVDTQDLKSCDHCGRAGSSPARGTKIRVRNSSDASLESEVLNSDFFFCAYFRFIVFVFIFILAPAQWLRFAPPPVIGLSTVSFGSFGRFEACFDPPPFPKRMPLPSLARAGISSYSNLLEAIDILLLICRSYGAGIQT